MKFITRKKQTKPGHMFLAAALLSLAACGGGGGGGETSPPPEDKGVDVNAYLTEVSTWNEYSPVLESLHGPTEDPTGNPDDYALPDPNPAHENCTVTKMSIQETPQEIVLYNPNGQVLWLGNLITGDSYKTLGSFDQLSVKPEERAPMTISIDFLDEDNFIEVTEPSLASVQSAIGKLVSQAQEAGLVTSSNASYTSTVAHSKEQVTLELGFSAKYLGAKASADLDFTRTNKTNTVVAHFVQKLYTVYVDPPVDGQGFFSEKFTEESLQRVIDAGQIGPNNPPAYISSIGYGRILTYKLTGEFSEQELSAAVNFSYNSATVDASAEAKAKEILEKETTNIEVVAAGGNQDAVLALIKAGKLGEYFESATPLTAVQPISYQISSVKKPTSLASVTNVSEYDLKTCDLTPPPPEAPKPIGQTVNLTLLDVRINSDCDGTSKGDIWGHFNLDDDRVYTRPRSGPAGVEDVGTLSLGTDAVREFTFYYDTIKQVRVSGALKDKDDGLGGGADDTIGNWDFYVKLNTVNKSGTIQTMNGTGSCDKANTLRYKVNRTGFVYP
ncbi:MAG: thiol-activated cytolysin family protein [Gammaproteobacteria bacterium]|nr:thiol-activated cytolysin family protein [Gammaproteobacteria bacterium]